MKGKMLNVIGYIIFVIIATWLFWLVIEGLDDTPVGSYHKALDEGTSWIEYAEKN